MSGFDGRAFARNLAAEPGVYLMRDTDGKALYVGKARNLRKRVASYFDRRDKGPRINLMVRKIASIEVSITRTEAEALLLENEWIKALKPRFNINLRDDKSYPWIRLSSAHDFPRVSFYRGSRDRKGDYFGPYSSAGAVRETLNQIYRLFGIRQCRDSVFANRSRPCLQYQIGRCSAPCVGLISQEDYARDVDAASEFLRGREDAVIEYLAERMRQASEALDFERAASYRDQIQAVQQIRSSQYVADGAENLDVIAMAGQGSEVCFQVVEFRHGRNVGSRAFFPGNLAAESSADDLMAAFIGQYYAERQPPAEIVLSQRPAQAGLWSEALTRRRGAKVRLAWRLRGQRASWVRMALSNADDALRRHQAERDQVGRKLAALAELLKLPAAPERIECFDISHLSGTETVAACVVFGPGGAERKEYRHYNISDIQPGDDYAALDQAIRRRYRRALEENRRLPDLLLIDGGKAQAARAMEVMEELGLDAIPVVGIAKGPGRRAGHETWILDDREVRPGPHHPASHLAQQVRDEAHRFAITSHRRRRAKRVQASPLEEIPGIGPRRRQQLLKHFGGLKGVSRAGVEELSRVPGISQTLARSIAEHLRKR